MAISTQSQLEEVFGAGSRLNWYGSDESLAGTGFTLSVSSAAASEKYTVRLEV